MKTNNTVLIVSIILLLIIAMVVWAYGSKLSGSVGDNDNWVACTMDAKLCPDGSYVGRTGPKCEFSACPDAQ